MRTPLLAVGCLLTGALLAAQQPATKKKPQTLDELQQAEAQDQATAALDEIRQVANKAKRKRELDCLRVFGDMAFCACIREEAPAVSTFAEYVRAVTTSKEELGYAKLHADGKGYVDSLLRTREVCVGARQSGG